MKITKTITLLLSFSCSIIYAQQNNKTLEELHKEVKIAAENNETEKVIQLSKQIQQLNEQNEKIKLLEEEKQIAIFYEKYEEVIAIEKKIENIKNGVVAPPQTNLSSFAATPPSTNNNAQQPINQNNLLESPASTSLGTSKSKPTKPVNLDEYEYKDKVIGSFGMGFKTFEETYTGLPSWNGISDTYTEDYSLIALQLSNHRWWINKYVAGGLFYDVIFGGERTPSIQFGAQISALADFDAIILPYTSFGLGFGIKENDDISANFDIEESETTTYLPFNYKLGSYLFFNQMRSFGAFIEYNIYLNNEFTPHFRFGLAWTRVKSKARR